MVTKEELETAKTLWEQARQSAAMAHQTWALVIQSQKAVMASIRQAGFPFSEATKQFEALMEDHADRYKKALEHMDNTAKAYGELLEHFRKMSS